MPSSLNQKLRNQTKKLQRYLEAYRLDSLGFDYQTIATQLGISLHSVPVFIAKAGVELAQLDVNRTLDMRERAINTHRYYQTLAIQTYEEADQVDLSTVDVHERAALLRAKQSAISTASAESEHVEKLQGLHAKDAATSTTNTTTNTVIIQMPNGAKVPLDQLPTPELDAMIAALGGGPPGEGNVVDSTFVDAPPPINRI